MSELYTYTYSNPYGLYKRHTEWRRKDLQQWPKKVWIFMFIVSVLDRLCPCVMIPLWLWDSGGVCLQDVLRLEADVKTLHAAVDQIQVTLASPDLNRLSLREQLTQRQVNTFWHFSGEALFCRLYLLRLILIWKQTNETLFKPASFLFPFSVSWWKWRVSSSKWWLCSSVRAPSGYQRRYWPLCQFAAQLRLCSKRPASCSTPPSSSATSCR